MSNIELDIKKLISSSLGVKIDKITNESDFVQDLGADSLDSVELIMELEDRYKIEISEEEAETLTNFGNVMKLLETRKII